MPSYLARVEQADPEIGVLLVVEDDPDMRLLIRATLNRNPGLVVFGEATSAEAALDLARTNDPGLIILDHSLDGKMTGLAAAPLLKQAAPAAKILLFTAYDLAAEARAEPAVDAYLRKDDIHRLLPTVEHLLGIGP